MLTDLKARKAEPREKAYKIADSGGLSLHVLPSGYRSWRMKYRFGGKERRIVFGEYPKISLKDARAKRDDARKLLDDHRDPGTVAKAQKLKRIAEHGVTFEKVARDWHGLQKDRWKERHADDVITSLERDIFPALGSLPITIIDEQMLLTVLRKVEARGAIETAHRLLQRAGEIFKFGKGAGYGNSNPAADMKGSLKPVPQRKRWPALVNVERLRSLIADVDRAEAGPITRLASRFMALTAQRPGMIRGLPWPEIDGVDWNDPRASSPNAMWIIPAQRMKLELHLSDDDAFDHWVPLAEDAVAVLRVVHRLTGRGPLAFPNTRNAHASLSENAIGYLYNRLGYHGEHVPHGWRSSFSTVMNGRVERAQPGADRLIIERLIIDLMLAHTPSGLSPSELRYNRHGYIERRRELAEGWAAILMAGQMPAADLLEGPRRPRPARTSVVSAEEAGS